MYLSCKYIGIPKCVKVAKWIKVNILLIGQKKKKKGFHF
jgi:hypothetical protein